MKAEVTRRGVFSMQICVPVDWSDALAKDFADTENPCGTTNGWFIRKDGNKALAGGPERADCFSRENFVHIMLDA